MTIHSYCLHHYSWQPKSWFSLFFSFPDPINPCPLWKPYNLYYFLAYSPPKPNPNSSKPKLYQIHPWCSKSKFVVPLVLLQYHMLFPSIFFYLFIFFFFFFAFCGHFILTWTSWPLFDCKDETGGDLGNVVLLPRVGVLPSIFIMASFVDVVRFVSCYCFDRLIVNVKWYFILWCWFID